MQQHMPTRILPPIHSRPPRHFEQRGVVRTDARIINPAIRKERCKQRTRPRKPHHLPGISHHTIRVLARVTAQLPPQLGGLVAQLPHLPASYTLNRHKTDATASVNAVWPLYMGGATSAARSLADARTHEAQADSTRAGDELASLLVQPKANACSDIKKMRVSLRRSTIYFVGFGLVRPVN